MSEPNNPAGRLYALLDAAKVPPRQGDSTAVRHRWADVLEVDRDDLPTLLARLSPVIALPSQVREAISSIPDLDHQRYLRYLPKVEQAFSNLNLGTAWQHFAAPIDTATMHGLELCDERLSALRSEPTLAEDERAELHQQVRNLFDDVAANEGKPDLREFLLRHLSAMDQALSEYRISGTPPVENAVRSATGELVLRKIRGEDLPHSSRSDRFWKIFTRVALVLNLLQAGIALPQTIVDALPVGQERPAAQIIETDAGD